MNRLRSYPRWVLPMALLLASLAAAAETSPAPAPALAIPRTLDIPNGALVAPGPAPEVDLLYTGDVIGYVEPCG